MSLFSFVEYNLFLFFVFNIFDQEYRTTYSKMVIEKDKGT